VDILLYCEDIKVGAELDAEGFKEALTEMVNAAGMSAADAESYLANMGIDAEVKEAEESHQVQKYYTDLVPVVTYKPFDNVKVAEDDSVETTTGYVPTISYQPMTKSYEETVVEAGTALEVTSANKSSGGNFKFSNASHGSGSAGRAARTPSGGGGGGGGGSAPKVNKIKKDKQKKTYGDEFDRYWQINQSIDKVTHALSLLGQEQDYVFGLEKVKNIEAQNKQLKEQVKNIRALQAEQKKEKSELQGLRTKDHLKYNKKTTVYVV
jgi:hypothetical protein